MALNGWICVFLVGLGALGQSGGGEAEDSSPFVKKSYAITGRVTLEQEGGHWVLILSDDFKTKSGPDLQLIFSPLPVADADKKNATAKGTLTIGLLKDNKGGQRYVLPEGFDPNQYKSVLIHCVKYAVLWGGADLKK